MSGNGNDKGFEQAVAALKIGSPVLFPTDTVVGIGVSVRDCPSPQILFDLKGRPAGKPVAWLVGGTDALDVYGCDVPSAAYDLVSERWPGPLTIVVKASGEVPVPYRSNAGTIGLRMPASNTVLALIDAVGCPLATTSANLSGVEPPCTVEEVPLALRESAVTLLSPDLGSGVASKVVDFTTDPPTVIR